MPITTGSTPKALMGGRKVAPPMASDAMRYGAHQSLQSSSQHKKLVSSVLHLKQESIGHRANPTAYSSGRKQAFPRAGGSK